VIDHVLFFSVLQMSDRTGKVCRYRTLDTRQNKKADDVSDFEVVGKVSDFEDNQGKAVPVDGRMVAVFRQGDEWYAIDDLCPHMGASLAEGHVEDKTVTCPWHAWRFCIKDGTWEDNPRVKVESFDVKIEGDDVMVRSLE
jgi:nitrite reductase (NADH) small subunit/3-phenylpropionate/trans-cinnamate dioxygenase ferredoxin subunit